MSIRKQARLSYLRRVFKVVPFRVSGFGPYARVLEGLDYEASGQGLLPHANVSKWIENQTELLMRIAEQQY